MIQLTIDQKHNILEVMAAEMNKHKENPTSKQIGKAAEALVSKHPCLIENGFKTMRVGRTACISGCATTAPN